MTASRSWFHDCTNLSTPSSSSTLTTSSRSMPAAVGVERLMRRGVLGHHGVALHGAVVAHGVERRLGHRVDGVGGDEVDDVAGVGVRRVLHAGRGPERALHVGARGGQGLAAVQRHPRRTPQCAMRALAITAVPRNGE